MAASTVVHIALPSRIGLGLGKRRSINCLGNCGRAWKARNHCNDRCGYCCGMHGMVSPSHDQQLQDHTTDSLWRSRPYASYCAGKTTAFALPEQLTTALEAVAAGQRSQEGEKPRSEERRVGKECRSR